jgi:hypothetical protein
MVSKALQWAALRYAARGWPVFPVAAGGKQPLGRLARNGLRNASTDPKTVEQWWDKCPDANIGIATGIAFDVLDVDGDESWKSHAYAVAENGCLASSPVVITPSGGGHFYFLPTGAGNKAGFLPSLDWRGKGGYVVAPPSVSASGAVYDGVISVAEQPLQPVPSWLVGLWNKPTVSAYQKAAPAGGTTRYGRRALDCELGRLVIAPEGQRNHALNQAAFSLGQLVAGGELDPDTVTHDLFAAGLRAGLGEKECVATITSGLDAGFRQPRSTS